jgi:hypothetical protein
MEGVGIQIVHLVYFMATWYILWPLVFLWLFGTSFPQRISEDLRGSKRISEDLRGSQRISEDLRRSQRISEDLRGRFLNQLEIV